MDQLEHSMQTFSIIRQLEAEPGLSPCAFRPAVITLPAQLSVSSWYTLPQQIAAEIRHVITTQSIPQAGNPYICIDQEHVSPSPQPSTSTSAKSWRPSAHRAQLQHRSAYHENPIFHPTRQQRQCSKWERDIRQCNNLQRDTSFATLVLCPPVVHQHHLQSPESLTLPAPFNDLSDLSISYKRPDRLYRQTILSWGTKYSIYSRITADTIIVAAMHKPVTALFCGTLYSKSMPSPSLLTWYSTIQSIQHVARTDATQHPSCTMGACHNMVDISFRLYIVQCINDYAIINALSTTQRINNYAIINALLTNALLTLQCSPMCVIYRITNCVMLSVLLSIQCSTHHKPTAQYHTPSFQLYIKEEDACHFTCKC
jgi:hypothetical protein